MTRPLPDTTLDTLSLTDPQELRKGERGSTGQDASWTVHRWLTSPAAG